MKKELQKKTDLFLENRLIMREGAKLESESNYLFGAMLYTDENQVAKKNVLDNSLKIFKENTTLLSDLRFFSFPIIVKMSLHKNPAEYLENLKKNYKVLSKKSIFGSFYRILTSMIVCDYEKNISVDKLSVKEKKIYDMMKKKHPILTGDEDLAFAALFALSGRDEEKIINEMEAYYSVLKDYIKGNNNAQEIAEILTLESGRKEEKLRKAIEIYSLLTNNKKKLNNDFSHALIASLATLKESSTEIVEAILEVDSYIGAQKGKGLWSLGKGTRLMIAMMIVESYYSKNDRKLKGISLMSAVILEEILTFIATIPALVD